MILLTLALLLAPQETKTDEATDLSKLKIGRAVWGTPVQPVDIQGKVVIWRSWAG